MSFVRFYHLTATPLEKAMPKLMEISYQRGVRAVIWGHPMQVESIDKVLWTYSQSVFLPHGTAADPNPERQPIFLSPTLENPNQATLLVILHGAIAPQDAPFERVFDVFDGQQESEVIAARQRWKQYKSAGYGLEYAKQTPQGGWEIANGS